MRSPKKLFFVTNDDKGQPHIESSVDFRGEPFQMTVIQHDGIGSGRMRLAETTPFSTDFLRRQLAEWVLTRPSYYEPGRLLAEAIDNTDSSVVIFIFFLDRPDLQNQRVIGSVHAVMVEPSKIPGMAVISSSFVCPEFHRQGLGRAHFGTLKRVLERDWGVKKILLVPNESAKGFWWKVGCRPVVEKTIWSALELPEGVTNQLPDSAKEMWSFDIIKKD